MSANDEVTRAALEFLGTPLSTRGRARPPHALQRQNAIPPMQRRRIEFSPEPTPAPVAALRMPEHPWECSICFDQAAVSVPIAAHTCGYHWFHQSCIDRWSQRNQSCPVCRGGNNEAPIPIVAPNIMPQYETVLHDFVSECSECRMYIAAMEEHVQLTACHHRLHFLCTLTVMRLNGITPAGHLPCARCARRQRRN